MPRATYPTDNRIDDYFTLNGNICALVGTRDPVNIVIYDPIAADPEKIINQGRGNATARSIQVREGDGITGARS